MSFEDEVRRKKEESNNAAQRKQMWEASRLRPTDPIRVKPTGNVKKIIEEALPSIKKIMDYRDDRYYSYSQKKYQKKAPDNLVHVRQGGDVKSFDVELGEIEISNQYTVVEKWSVQIWIFYDGDVAYAIKRTKLADDTSYDDREMRLLRPEDYGKIKSYDIPTLENEIAKLKIVEITPEDLGITANFIRQKILDEVVKKQMIKEKTMSSKGCYIATAVYGSYDCPEVWVLRRYRDFILLRNPFGKLFVKFYYAISPTLVKFFGNTRWFRRFWKDRLDRMVARLRSNGINDQPYYD